MWRRKLEIELDFVLAFVTEASRENCPKLLKLLAIVTNLPRKLWN